jgi:hypothetical protein
MQVNALNKHGASVANSPTCISAATCQLGVDLLVQCMGCKEALLPQSSHMHYCKLHVQPLQQRPGNMHAPGLHIRVSSQQTKGTPARL